MEFVNQPKFVQRYEAHPTPPAAYKPHSYNPAGGTQFAPKLAPHMLGNPTIRMETAQDRAEKQKWQRNGFATNPTLASIKKLDAREAFKHFDADNSGSIDKEELMSALAALGLPVSATQASTILSKYDTDGNGTLELPEFSMLVADLQAGTFMDAIVAKASPDVSPSANPFESRLSVGIDARAVFNTFDRDGSGGLDESELQLALNHRGLNVSLAQARAFVTHYDSDGNKTLELDEFKRLLADLQRGTLMKHADPMPMRGGWPAGGGYSRGAGTWYGDGQEEPKIPKTRTTTTYGWKHRNNVNTSPLGADCP